MAGPLETILKYDRYSDDLHEVITRHLQEPSADLTLYTEMWRLILVQMLARVVRESGLSQDAMRDYLHTVCSRTWDEVMAEVHSLDAESGPASDFDPPPLP
jgi:hypothetical protein